ncbi:MAG: single-stranded-DNA-specific exonuclease RecJ, partial [Bacteroidales bacterium]|nr:single-stranded-DNA-specific exonuclease RecJ [Bacteroidales bacterium]
MKRKWINPSDHSDKIQKLKSDPRLTGISEEALKILINRNIETPSEIEMFLYGGLGDLWDTRLMKDAEKAVSIIVESLSKNEKIVVYGDYDCDGISGIATCMILMKNLGANIDFYTNNRFEDGYGMSENGIDAILKKHNDVKLLISVDVGIVAHDAILYAKQKDIKVIVTDHHEQGDRLPLADAVVDPKRIDCPYPNKDLCGAGVMFKLMLLLYTKLGKDIKCVYETLDIVAMATVGDVVSLKTLENRIIVKEGIKLIKSEKRMAFKAFREITNVSDINSHFTLGFIYVPMINAIGRMDGNPEKAIKIFLEQDENLVYENLDYLKELNELRKKITTEQCEFAENILLQKLNNDAYVIYDKSFHEGIVGLIAGRLKEKYNKPVVVLTDSKEGEVKGSARSIDPFHVKNAFDELNYLLLGYGGHAKAAGLSLKKTNLELFEKGFIDLCTKQLNSNDFVKKYNIDLFIKPEDINIDLIDDLQRLEPFGEGFN